MAQLVVAAAGAAIGGMIAPGVVAFGMTGAAMGWMAGSVVGSMFAPTQKSEGPRLGDLSVSGSSYGTPIPWVKGSPRIAGQVIWASQAREIATTTEQGKGGGGSEYTSYTYEVDLLIKLTDNIMAAVPQVWRNGELVYSILSDADPGTVEASINAGLWSRMTVYTGAADQLPDPDYEAAVGTANAPAYRGCCTVFIKSLQLGSTKQVPNLTFRPAQHIATGSTYTNFGTMLPSTWYAIVASLSIKDGFARVHVATGPGNTVSVIQMNLSDGSISTLGSYIKSYSNYILGAGSSIDGVSVWETNGSGFQVANFPGSLFIGSPGGEMRYTQRGNKFYYIKVDGNLVCYQNGIFFASNTAAISSSYRAQYIASNDSEVYILINNSTTIFVFDAISLIYIKTIVAPVYAGTQSRVLVNESGVLFYTAKTSGYDGKLYKYIGGSWSIVNNSLGLSCPGDCGWGNIPIDRVAISGEVVYTLVLSGSYSGASATLYASYPSTTIQNPTLPDVVADLMLLAGYTASQFDVSALPTSKVVRALANSSVSTARTVLDMLASTYFFDAVCTDKIYFVPRGGAPVATITWDELGVTADSTNAPDPLPITIANELEIPAQMALTYNNVDGDYQTDTQYSDRLLTGQESTSAVQVPMGFTAAEAKAIVDAMLLDKAVSALSTSIHVDITRAALVPTDVVQVVGEDGSTYRLRITKRTDAGGVTTLALVADDASVLVQAGTTSGGTTSQTTVLPVATTTLALLDVPLLRDADDKPGLYIAVMGNAANWAGCAIYESLDDVTYTQVTTLADQTTIGTCTTTLGDWAGGNVFDEVNTITVNVGAIQQLASVSRDDLLANQAVNAALIGSELVQYLRATLVSAGVYTLSGLLRGRRGTEWASTGHASGERFVALGASGLRYLTLQSADLGRVRYYKGVSAGQKLSDVTAQSITPLGVALECLSPVNARADRSAADTVLTWTRRTRLSTRLTGALPINTPLGELAEAYDVEVWDSTYTTLKRTLSATSPTATYTSAQQVADFGAAQAVLYLKIYQLSAAVARGYPLKVSV